MSEKSKTQFLKDKSRKPAMAEPSPQCPISMLADSRPCGRDLYVARTFRDDFPVCLMHSQHPSKDRAAFWSEVEAILSGKSKDHRPSDAYDFSGFSFPQSAFGGRKFEKKAIFSGARFVQKVDLEGSTFTKGVNFRAAIIRAPLFVYDARFFEEADFFALYTVKDAIFSLAKFFCRPDFGSARFVGDTSFQSAQFYSGANFSEAQFTLKANFSGSTVGISLSPDMYLPRGIGESSAVVADFTSVVFERPDSAVFLQVNRLSSHGLRIRLVNCNVRKVRFEDVNWYRPKGRLVLQDELDIRATPPQSGATHELIANTYRSLTKNFEGNRHYDLAEECFCGEMEMKRLDPAHFLFPRFFGGYYSRHRWARNCAARLSFAYLYSVLSKYGSSYIRALVWLVAFLIFFAVLLPSFGLRMTEARNISQENRITLGEKAAALSESFSWSDANQFRDAVKIFGAGMWTALDTATFRKNATVEPATKWGKRAALIEMVVMPSQLALFLLALRRRFRR
jgi:uncharacterized protein YjbI with pentapeptide repeats